MKDKKFIPCIYLYQGKAVAGLKKLAVIEADPVKLAAFYHENHADELLVFDRSTGDEEHQKALDTIREICEKVAIPVIGTGNIRRMEDVKKLLYAGCKKVALNYARESNRALTAEVSKRFGREKIAACIGDMAEMTETETLLNEFVDEIIIINETCIRTAAAASRLPLLVSVPKVSLDKIMELLSHPMIRGITGNGINENAKELLTIKELCRENGLSIRIDEPVAKIGWHKLKPNSDGLIPVVTQDYRTGQVLMVAYMNEAAYLLTLKTGKMTYYSRSREELWIKGETSGHYQYVKSLTTDCDMDTILARVRQEGAACHTGQYSCFFNEIIQREEAEETNPYRVFEKVLGVIADRKIHPKEGSYTNYLFDKGLDKILKKMGEEATEIVIAAKNPNSHEIKYEISDFLYHMMVLMAEKGISWEEITDELARR